MNRSANILLATAMAMTFVLVAGVATAAPLVYLDPVTTDVCGEFTVDVVINDEVLDLTGFDLLIDFDETILNVVGAAQGQLLDDYPGTPFFYWTVTGTVSDALLINGAALGGSINGAGVLATITFACESNGLTDLEFAMVEFRDIDNLPIPVTSDDAEVNSDDNATVYIDPALVGEEVGTPFSMQVMLGDGIADVNSIDLVVTFDHTVLETLAVHPGPDLPGGQASLALTGGVGYIIVDINPPVSISSPGSILVIEFNGIHEGDFTAVAIEDLVFGTTTGTVIQPCVGDGTVTITGPSPVEPMRWGMIKSLYR